MKNMRFPLLIGGGLIAAGLLYYYAGSKSLNREQMQGAIGQREVYREADAAAVGTNVKQGAAPVAVMEILKSGPFEKLSKDPSFKALLNDSNFQELAKEKAFFSLLSDQSFSQLTSNPNFAELLASGAFQSYLHEYLAGTKNALSSGKNNLNTDNALKDATALIAKAGLQGKLDSGLLANYLSNADYMALAKNAAFANVLESQYLQELKQHSEFAQLLNTESFQKAFSENLTSDLATASKARD